MTTSNPPEQDTPPRPSEVVTVADFGRALRNLRRWSRLTQKALEDAHPALTDSTISDHERGVRLPRYEWLQAYVVACLRSRRPGSTREALNAEMTHWRTTWTRLEHAEPPQAPTVPTQRAAATQTPPDADTTPTPAAGTLTVTDEPAPKRHRVRLPRGRVLLVSGGAVVLVVAAAIYATATGLFDHKSGPGPAQYTGTTTPAVPVYASGTVDDLGTKQGIDLDTGQRLDQNADGVDISFSSSSTHMDAMDNRVYYQVLPQPVTAPEKRMCDLKDGWKRWYADVHTLIEGRNICVKTDEGRLSMMTVTKRATNATGTISLRYITWP